MKKENKSKQTLSPRDQMLHIMKVIWSSRSAEQLKGCRNMINTFEKENGSDNIGLTLMEIEFIRQQRLNQLFANMGKVQNALKKENAEKAKKTINPKMLIPKDQLKKN